MNKVGYLILFFCTLFSITSCKKEETNPTESTLTSEEKIAAISSEYFVYGEIDNEFTLNEFKNNESISGGGGGTFSDDYVEEHSSNNISFSNGTYSVDFLLHFNTISPTMAMYEEFYKKTSFNYGVSYSYNDNTKGKEGIVITFVDSDEVVWSTTLGEQTKNTFEITEFIYDEQTMNQFQADKNERAYRIFTLKFSCTVYDNKGNSKTLNNMVYRGKLQYSI